MVNYLISEEYANFKNHITHHTLIHEDMRVFLEAYPIKAHPMGILAASLSTISTFYPESQDPNRPKEAIDLTIYRLLAKVPTLAAWAYKNAVGQPVVYPKNKFDYCENFVNMMFDLPAYDYVPDPVVVNALNTLLILHADHEQNCSASHSQSGRVISSQLVCLCFRWCFCAMGPTSRWSQSSCD